MALSSCRIPGAREPNFTLGEDEMELGMGIHGEPGLHRTQLMPADALVDEITDRLLAEKPADARRVTPLVNSLGATPLEELLIMYRRVCHLADKEGLAITFPLVGPYVTSMEMAGASISVLHLDDELETLLSAPADCPFWKA